MNHLCHEYQSSHRIPITGGALSSIILKTRANRWNIIHALSLTYWCLNMNVPSWSPRRHLNVPSLQTSRGANALILWAPLVLQRDGRTLTNLTCCPVTTCQRAVLRRPNRMLADCRQTCISGSAVQIPRLGINYGPMRWWWGWDTTLQLSFFLHGVVRSMKAFLWFLGTCLLEYVWRRANKNYAWKFTNCSHPLLVFRSWVIKQRGTDTLP